MSRAGFDEQGRSMSRAVEGVSPTEFMGVKIRVKISRGDIINIYPGSFDRYTLPLLPRGVGGGRGY